MSKKLVLKVLAIFSVLLLFGLVYSDKVRGELITVPTLGDIRDIKAATVTYEEVYRLMTTRYFAENGFRYHNIGVIPYARNDLNGWSHIADGMVEAKTDASAPLPDKNVIECKIGGGGDYKSGRLIGDTRVLSFGGKNVLPPFVRFPDEGMDYEIVFKLSDGIYTVDRGIVEDTHKWYLPIFSICFAYAYDTGVDATTGYPTGTFSYITISFARYFELEYNPDGTVKSVLHPTIGDTSYHRMTAQVSYADVIFNETTQQPDENETIKNTKRLDKIFLPNDTETYVRAKISFRKSIITGFFEIVLDFLDYQTSNTLSYAWSLGDIKQGFLFYVDYNTDTMPIKIVTQGGVITGIMLILIIAVVLLAILVIIVACALVAAVLLATKTIVSMGLLVKLSIGLLASLGFIVVADYIYEGIKNKDEKLSPPPWDLKVWIDDIRMSYGNEPPNPIATVSVNYDASIDAKRLTNHPVVGFDTVNINDNSTDIDGIIASTEWFMRFITEKKTDEQMYKKYPFNYVKNVHGYTLAPQNKLRGLQYLDGNGSRLNYNPRLDVDYFYFADENRTCWGTLYLANLPFDNNDGFNIPLTLTPITFDGYDYVENRVIPAIFAPWYVVTTPLETFSNPTIVKILNNESIRVDVSETDYFDLDTNATYKINARYVATKIMLTYDWGDGTKDIGNAENISVISHKYTLETGVWRKVIPVKITFSDGVYSITISFSVDVELTYTPPPPEGIIISSMVGAVLMAIGVTLIGTGVGLEITRRPEIKHAGTKGLLVILGSIGAAVLLYGGLAMDWWYIAGGIGLIALVGVAFLFLISPRLELRLPKRGR